ncbi:MAG: cupin domain-containing protein [Elusimicrobia bacterium]|nr:cupin domain-containing protein [Elusimicrobiota bacterium]
MKTLSAVALAVLLSPFAAAADMAAEAAIDPLDPLMAAKGLYTLKNEDADTRVLEVTLRPGQKTGLHHHPKHMAYVLQPGKIKIVEEGREAQEMQLKTGQVITMPAQTHWAENVGSSQVKLLVVEFKDK